MMTKTKIKRALISVYDKTGVVDFARSLSDEFGVAIISTGGTAVLLRENHIPVTLVEEVTGFPEMMDGRVKTLHPKIHAAILADRDNPDHMRQLAAQGIEPIDMVVVNLYPFEKTIADPDCTFEQAIEMIDIGGPCMLRAAAKNHKHVWVVTDPEYYTSNLAEMRDWNDSSLRRIALDRGGIDAFALTCALDAGIVKWLTKHSDTGRIGYNAFFTKMIDHLRYGENPHQSASVTTFPRETMLEEWNAASHQADVELSFNNYVDGHAALALCKELVRSIPHVGPTFQSVNAGSTTTGPITDETHTKRHLPHIQTPGSHYFVTFRIRQGSLNPKERTIVLDACRFLHGTKMTLHACVVMPDHVHLVITPHQISPGCWVSLGEIAKSIKGVSARTINKQRDAKGSLWMDEVWDRIIRDENEYLKRLDYITGNPSKADLGEDYEWVWVNDRAWDDLAANDRLESRSHIRESRSHIRQK
ncbi:MAG: transposase, partial [Planctomycetes bacterium]|nr:transposase [Planctomycetota bacterium]